MNNSTQIELGLDLKGDEWVAEHPVESLSMSGRRSLRKGLLLAIAMRHDAYLVPANTSPAVEVVATPPANS